MRSLKPSAIVNTANKPVPVSRCHDSKRPSEHRSKRIRFSDGLIKRQTMPVHIRTHKQPESEQTHPPIDKRGKEKQGRLKTAFLFSDGLFNSVWQTDITNLRRLSMLRPYRCAPKKTRALRGRSGRMPPFCCKSGARGRASAQCLSGASRSVRAPVQSVFPH